MFFVNLLCAMKFVSRQPTAKVGAILDQRLNYQTEVPAVYLLIMSGRKICIGTRGIANMASVSLATPASMSFNPVTASVAAKPIYKNIQIEILKILRKIEIFSVTL